MTTTNGEPLDEELEEISHPDPDYITDETRRAVLARDNYRCRRCGEQDKDKLHLHHVVYRSQLGGHDEDNLVTICSECHRLIHDKKVTVKRILGKWFFGGIAHWRSRHTR